MGFRRRVHRPLKRTHRNILHLTLLVGDNLKQQGVEKSTFWGLKTQKQIPAAASGCSEHAEQGFGPDHGSLWRESGLGLGLQALTFGPAPPLSSGGSLGRSSVYLELNGNKQGPDLGFHGPPLSKWVDF